MQNRTMQAVPSQNDIAEMKENVRSLIEKSEQLDLRSVRACAALLEDIICDIQQKTKAD